MGQVFGSGAHCGVGWSWCWWIRNLRMILRFLHRLKEPGSPPCQRFDEPRMTGGISQHLANLVYDRVQAAIEIDKGVGRPQSLPQFLAADDLPLSLEQEKQNLEGLLLEPHAHA